MYMSNRNINIKYNPNNKKSLHILKNCKHLKIAKLKRNTNYYSTKAATF